jgi:hypothetical protein
MKLDYRKFMEDWDITLDHPVLDKAFVVKARKFEADLAEKKLTDEQIKETDAELLRILTEEHKFEEVDSEEVVKEKLRNRILEAKNKISEAESVEAIEALQEEYKDVYKELKEFIAKRIEKLQKAADSEARKKVLDEGSQEIEAAGDDILESLQDKYKDYPELLKKISARIEKRPAKDKTLREKILDRKKRGWTFDELREVGVKVTGDDMEVEGIVFERQYGFKVYHIRMVDNKKV